MIYVDTCIQHLHGIKRIELHTFVWIQKWNFNIILKLKGRNFDNSKKNYNIENVQYEKFKNSINKWIFFEENNKNGKKKTLNETPKSNFMRVLPKGCTQLKEKMNLN
jgi:hypothetical protein